MERRGQWTHPDHWATAIELQIQRLKAWHADLRAPPQDGDDLHRLAAYQTRATIDIEFLIGGLRNLLRVAEEAASASDHPRLAPARAAFDAAAPHVKELRDYHEHFSEMEFRRQHKAGDRSFGEVDVDGDRLLYRANRREIDVFQYATAGPRFAAALRHVWSEDVFEAR